MTPPTINAYCSSRLNTINFPAGILPSPYFEKNMVVTANPHSLPIFRVDNVVSNMHQFAQALAARLAEDGPGHACRVW